MNIICLIDGAQCPKNLQVCCGICDHNDDCLDRCGCIGEGFDPQKCPDAEVVSDELVGFESAVPDTLQKITSLMRLKKELDEQEKTLKQKLVQAMEAYNIKSFENEDIKMTYVAPTTRSSLDSAKLKKDHPAIAEQYTKVSDVAASVRVTVK